MSDNLYKDKTDIVIKFEFDIGETVRIKCTDIFSLDAVVVMLGFDGQPQYKIAWFDQDFKEKWFPEWQLQKIEQVVEEDYERLKPSKTVPL